MRVARSALTTVAAGANDDPRSAAGAAESLPVGDTKHVRHVCADEDRLIEGVDTGRAHHSTAVCGEKEGREPLRLIFIFPLLHASA